MNNLTKPIYQYQIDEHLIEFSSISAEFAERVYSAIQKENNPYFLEYIFNKITSDKYALENLEAGIIINVIFSALKLSGTVKEPIDVPERIEYAREVFSSGLYNSIFSSIARVLPNYKLSELKMMTFNELIETLVFAEKVSGKEIFDTKKLKDSFSEFSQPKTTTSSRKGVSAISQDQIDFLKQMLNKEENEGPFF